jgi:chromosome segregation ATPase
VTREKTNAERRFSQAEAETANADERAARLTKRLDEYVAKLKTSTATLERLSKENEALAERLAFAEAKSASLLGAVAARDAKLAAADAEAEAAASRLAAATRARDAARAENERLRTALAELRVESSASTLPRTPSRSADGDEEAGSSHSENKNKKASDETRRGRRVTVMHAATRRGLRSRDVNAPEPEASSPLASPGKAKARRFAAAAKRASVAAAVGAGAWRAVRERGGAPAAVPVGVL